MVSIINQNDIIANNLANINTVGFKQLIPTFKDIREVDVQQEENKNDNGLPGLNTIGSLSAGSVLDDTRLDFSQGAIKPTGGKLDVALNGNGFFAVQTNSGECYTRNGNFSLNADGDLVTKAGYKVLGSGGSPINIDLTGKSEQDIVITNDGRITFDNEEVGKFKVVDFKDKSKLKMMGDSLFKNIDANTKPVPLENFSVMQGHLETSNANVVKSMINSITGSRTYETLARIISQTDQTLRKTVNEVGTVVG